MINYRQSSDAARNAWFRFKDQKPQDATSVVSFVAGYNSAAEDVYRLAKLHFEELIEAKLIQYPTALEADRVREMLDSFAVDVCVSDWFFRRMIPIDCVKAIGNRFVPQSRSLGPIIVDANDVLGNKSDFGMLGPVIVIEGKHRWLDAKERGEKEIEAWVGRKAIKKLQALRILTNE